MRYGSELEGSALENGKFKSAKGGDKLGANFNWEKTHHDTRGHTNTTESTT